MVLVLPGFPRFYLDEALVLCVLSLVWVLNLIEFRESVIDTEVFSEDAM